MLIVVVLAANWSGGYWGARIYLEQSMRQHVQEMSEMHAKVSLAYHRSAQAAGYALHQAPAQDAPSP
jgi:hypothetical protein